MTASLGWRRHNAINRATTATDALGQATVYRYDASGQLLSVSSPAVGGVVSTVSYTYDAVGNVTRITDAEGRAVAMDYDSAGNVIRQTDAAGTSDTNARWVYSNSGAISRVYDSERRDSVVQLQGDGWNTGYFLSKDSARSPWSSKGSVISWDMKYSDPSMATGYRIHTGFPIQ